VLNRGEAEKCIQDVGEELGFFEGFAVVGSHINIGAPRGDYVFDATPSGLAGFSALVTPG
jgi:hypothetical protein